MKLKRTCLSDDSGNKSERQKPKTLEQLTRDNVRLLCRLERSVCLGDEMKQKD